MTGRHPVGHRYGWPVSRGSYCRGCRCAGCREQQRAYYQANREKVAEQQRAYYQANREKVAEQQRAYREALPTVLAAAETDADEIAVERLCAIVRAGDRVGRNTYPRIDKFAAAITLARAGESTSMISRLGFPYDWSAAIIRWAVPR